MPEEISERKDRLLRDLGSSLEPHQVISAIEAFKSVEEMIKPVAETIPNDLVLEIFKCLVAQREVESSPDKYPSQTVLLGWFNQAAEYYQALLEKRHPDKEQLIANLRQRLELFGDQFFQFRYDPEEVSIIKIKWSPIKRLIDDITAPSFPQEPGAQ